jgi:hypothetical protein
MADLLNRLEYVYKKPKLVPRNPDKEAQEIFLDQYLAFMKLKKKMSLYFLWMQYILHSMFKLHMVGSRKEERKN